jgi:hypothetical protein
VALTAAGLTAASVAVWYQHRQTRRALDFWGAALAQRIERATVVELFELNSGTAEGTPRAQAAIDISHAPGVLHFRRSLLQDANFVWDAQDKPAASASDWDFSVRFSDDEGSMVVLFELDRGMIASRDTPERVVQVTEKMSLGLRLFFEEQL